MSSAIHRVLILGLGLTASAGPLLAQTQVAGTVRDSATGVPVARAHATLRGTSFQTTTDAGGRFVLRDVPPGRHHLEVRAVGYYPPPDRSIDVVAGETLTLEIRLGASPVRLVDLVVTPSRFGVAEVRPSAVTLTREDVETLPQLGEDLYRAIERLPGLSSYDYSARFWVRGAPNDEVLARFDGVDLLEPFHLKDFDGALSIIDVEAIDRLSLTTGGFTADYGDRLAGVLEMETLSESVGPVRTTLGLSASSVRAGSRGTFDGGRGRWLASARRGYLDVLLSLIGREEDINPRYHDVSAKVEYRLGDGHQLSAHLLRAGDELRYRSGDDPLLESSYGSTYGWIRWKGRFGPDLRSETVLSAAGLSWNRSGLGAFNGRDSLDLRDRRRLDLVALRQDWVATLSEPAAVRWGVELKHGQAEYDYRRWRERTAVVNDALARVRDTVAAALAPEGTAFAAWVAPRFRPVASLTLEAGLRFDRHSWTGENTWSPRANLAWSSGATTIRAAWGRYQQAQALHQLAVMDGDTTFSRSERAEHRILGIEHQAGGNLTLRVEGYQRLTAPVRPQYVNFHDFTNPFADVDNDRIRLAPTRGRARGIELFAEHRPGRRIRWSASYGLASVEQEVDGAWIPRIRDQRHSAEVSVTWTPGADWRVSGSWQFHSGWPYTGEIFTVDTLGSGEGVLRGSTAELYGARLPAYHRLDLRVTRRIGIGGSVLRAFVDVFNAYRRENLTGFVYDVRLDDDVFEVRQMGRKLLPIIPTVGVSWEF